MAFKSKIPDNLVMGYCALGDNHFAVAGVRYCLCPCSRLDADWFIYRPFAGGAAEQEEQACWLNQSNFPS